MGLDTWPSFEREFVHYPIHVIRGKENLDTARHAGFGGGAAVPWFCEDRNAESVALIEETIPDTPIHACMTESSLFLDVRQVFMTFHFLCVMFLGPSSRSVLFLPPNMAAPLIPGVLGWMMCVARAKSPGDGEVGPGKKCLGWLLFNQDLWDLVGCWSPTHLLHVCNIYLHVPEKKHPNVGMCSIHGAYGQ